MQHEQKKEYALLLFLQGDLSQKEIATRVNISEQTISAWANENGWATMRKSIILTRTTQINRLYDQLEELNSKISSRPKGQRFADVKELNALNIITKSIKALETDTTLAQIIEVGKQCADYWKSIDNERAKTIVECFDLFIQHRATR